MAKPEDEPVRPPKPPPNSREARLAEALRANLRRRKKPKEEEEGKGDS